MAITDLDRGTRYSVVLVATTGTEEKSLETDSDIVILKTAGQGIYIQHNYETIILYLIVLIYKIYPKYLFSIYFYRKDYDHLNENKKMR